MVVHTRISIKNLEAYSRGNGDSHHERPKLIQYVRDRGILGVV